MIGAIISMKFLGKKKWIQAIIFWAVILIIGFAIGSGAVQLGIFATLLGIGIFILLAHYWYHLPWLLSIAVWFVAFIIDMIIVYILVLLLIPISYNGLGGIF